MTPAEFKRVREKLQFTQEELGQQLEMAANSIARMERGESPIMKTTALALRYLELTMKKQRRPNKTA